MPPRRREPRPRAGARPGDLSADVRNALAAEVERMRTIAEPSARARAVGDAFAAFDAELEALAKVRLDAVRELRAQKLTHAAIAEATGLSESRVRQLFRDPRARRAQP